MNDEARTQVYYFTTANGYGGLQTVDPNSIYAAGDQIDETPLLPPGRLGGMSMEDEQTQGPPTCAECGKCTGEFFGFSECWECGNWYCAAHSYRVGQCIYEDPEW